MKHILSVFACLCLSLSAFSSGVGTDTISGSWHGITYTLTLPDSVLTFTGSGRIYQPGRSIVYPWNSIKSQVKHLRIEGTITNVPDQMLDSAANLETIWMSDNVKTVDSRVEVYYEGAFAECRKLKSVRLSSNLTIINWGTFFHCSSLRDIEIPSTVSTIGMWAFYGCSGMQEITCLRPTPPTVGSNAFTKTSIPLYVPSGSIPSYLGHSIWSRFNLLPLVVGTTAITPDTTELSWLPVDHASLYELHIYTDTTSQIVLDTTLLISADSINGGIMLNDTQVASRNHRITMDAGGSVIIITIEPNSGATTTTPFVVTVSTTTEEEIICHFNMKVYRGLDVMKEDAGTFILNDSTPIRDSIENLSGSYSCFTPFTYDINGRSYHTNELQQLPSGIYILRTSGETKKILKR